MTNITHPRRTIIKPVAFAIEFSLLVVLLTCALLALSIEAANGDSLWQYYDNEAEKQSRIGSGIHSAFTGMQSKALALNDSALTAVQSVAPLDSLALAALYCHRGDYYLQQGTIRAADSIWHVAHNLLLDKTDSASIWWGDECRLRIGISSTEMERKKHNSLTSNFADSLTALRRNPSSDKLKMLYRLASLYEKLCRYPEADSCQQELVRFSSETPSPSSRFMAVRMLMQMAENRSKVINSNSMNESTRQDSAIALGERALDIAEKSFGFGDTVVAFVLNRLGDYYRRAGFPRKSDSVWNRAWTINKSLLPPENIEYQGSLDRMGGVCMASGRYSDAEVIRRQALELRIRTQGKWHPEVASMLGSLGRVFAAQMKHDSAEILYSAALAIRRKVWAWDHSDIATSLIDLGRLQCERAHFSQAQRHFEEALRIRQHSLGDDHALTADCRDALGDLYVAWNRPQEALAMYTEAMKTRELFHGTSHPAILSSLSRIADIQLANNDWEGALGNLHRAILIADKIYGDTSLARWVLASKEAEALCGIDMTDSALAILLCAQNVFERSLSVNGIVLLENTLRLANTYDHANDDVNERNCYVKVREILLADTTPLPEFARSCEKTAAFFVTRGEIPAAAEMAEMGFAIRMQNFSDAQFVMPERELLALSSSVIASRDLLLSILAAEETMSDSVAVRFAQVARMAKSPLFDALRNQKAAQAGVASSVVAPLADSLQFIRRKLAALCFQGESQAAGRSRDMVLLSQTKHTLELRLSKELANVIHDTTQTAPQIAGSGSNSDAQLINYVKFLRTFPNSQRQRHEYAAIVNADSGGPVVAFLGDAATIDSQVGLYADHMNTMANRGSPPSTRDFSEYLRIAGKLVDLVWNPIAANVDSGSRITIAPDGELSRISFSSLPTDGSKFLADDVVVSYVSLRYVTPLVSRAGFRSGIAVFGDIDYDASADSRLLSMQTTLQMSNPDTALYAVRSVRSSCDSILMHAALPLPAASEEINFLETILSGRNQAVHILRGVAGSEENFRVLAPQQRRIHIATHGFFIPETCHDITSADPSSHTIAENPLLRSGLLLSGSNRRFDTSGSSQREDGVLTAEEIVGLNFAGVDVVILSGCETGLGATSASQGLIGLQRAFQAAGVSSVVSSLWSVADAPASRIMMAMYADSSASLQVALNTSSRRELRNLRERRQPPHPFLWAPFIVTSVEY